MKFKSMTFFGCLLVLFQFSCEKWDVEQISFLEVATGTAQPAAIGTAATLEGTISGLVAGDLAEEHGHVWSQHSPEPSLTDKDGQTNLGRLENGPFSSQIDGLSPGASYAYRAYALLGDKVAYGAVKTFQNSTINIQVQIDSIDLSNINSTQALAIIHSEISGIPNGLPIKSYGLLWGKQANLSFDKDNILPEQGIIAFEEQLSFTTRLPFLEADTYYVQAYLTINDKVYLGAIQEISPTNLWKPLAHDYFPTSNAVAGWSIGDKAYLAIYNGDVTIWEYDRQVDHWQQQATFPGEAKFSLIAFSVNGKGYLGGGQDANNNSRKELWEYDPSTHQFKQLGDLPGNLGRQEAFTFSVKDKAYLGSGVEFARKDGVFNINFLNDFWEYDPATDRWQQKADYPGVMDLLKFTSLGLSIGDKGYAGMGTSRLGDEFTDHRDFWEYDPPSDTWTRKADFPGETRLGSIGFTLGDKAYVGAGFRRVPRDEVKEKLQIPLADIWAYQPSTGLWSRVTDFPGTAHGREFAFSIQNQGYIATDVNSFCDVGRYFWVYRPD